MPGFKSNFLKMFVIQQRKINTSSYLYHIRSGLNYFGGTEKLYVLYPGLHNPRNRVFEISTILKIVTFKTKQFYCTRWTK